VLGLLLLLIIAARAEAQPGPSPQADQTRVVKLVVRPAAAPVPALKYWLMPPLIDQTPGNASSIYLIAANLLNTPLDTELVDQWLARPLDEAMKDRTVPGLMRQGVLDLLDEGSRRTYCHWETTMRSQGISTLLPHLNGLREGSRYLSVQARTQMAEGKHDDALRTIRTGVTLARHLNEQDAVLVQTLVGVAIFDAMADRLYEFSGRPGAPNLYWALAQLPRPFYEVHRVSEFERYAAPMTFPELRNIDAMTEEQGKKILRQILDIVDVGTQNKATDTQVARTLMLAAAYPRGKEYLKSRGVPAERVDRMSVHQVLLRYLLDDMLEKQDELTKWFALPYPMARRGLERAFESGRSMQTDNPFANALMPALHRARAKLASVDRRIALLMCVEAIRGYAAANGGKLPPSLLVLEETMPAPDDPMTGEPFAYRVGGDVATLEAAPDGALEKSGWTIEVRVAR
jgi:hypothetical protein